MPRERAVKELDLTALLSSKDQQVEQQQLETPTMNKRAQRDAVLGQRDKRLELLLQPGSWHARAQAACIFVPNFLAQHRMVSQDTPISCANRPNLLRYYLGGNFI